MIPRAEQCPRLLAAVKNTVDPALDPPAIRRAREFPAIGGDAPNPKIIAVAAIKTRIGGRDGIITIQNNMRQADHMPGAAGDNVLMKGAAHHLGNGGPAIGRARRAFLYRRISHGWRAAAPIIDAVLKP